MGSIGPDHIKDKPAYGGRLFVNILDDIAQAEPSRTFVVVPRSDEPKDGWKPVTYGEMTKAINWMAHKLIKTGGSPTGNTFPTVAFIAPPSDIRYAIFTLAAIKSHYQALLISPRNSTEGQLKLFEDTDCTTIWHTAAFEPMVTACRQRREMKAFAAPETEILLQADCEPFPYRRTFEEAEWDPMGVLHTSGSTGLPKPIVVRQGMVANADVLRLMPDFHGAQSLFTAFANTAERPYMSMPLFHAAGLSLFLILTLYYESTCRLGPSGPPLNPDLVLQILETGDVDSTCLPPSIVEDLSRMKAGRSALKKLTYVMFAGGGLDRKVGDSLVAEGVPLMNGISSTEFIPYPVYCPSDRRLWQYFVFDDDLMGSDWRRLPGDEDVYELVIVRPDVSKHPGLRGVFFTFPDRTEWSTGDLWKPHPTQSHHWVHYGRVDNIIVFSNGEKLNPTTIEEELASQPALRGALVVGQGRFQPALILEPVTPAATSEERDRLIEEVWPAVSSVNEETVAHGRIARQFIMVATADKPFPRSGKGSVQRGIATKLFEPEINALYERAEAASFDDLGPLDASSPEALEQSILTLFRDRLGAKLEPDSDFFSAGMDSLQVINGARLLRAGLVKTKGLNPDDISARVIYAHSTPKTLAKHLCSRIGQSPAGVGDEVEAEIQIMQALLDQYTKDLPASRSDRPPPRDDGQTVLVTGTTGSLGAYMLDLLVKDPGVVRVVALNRVKDGGRARQPAVSEERGLGTDFDKVDFLHVDLALPRWGLTEDVYTNLLRNADRIVHNAWPVNFNIGLSSFEPAIRGVRGLVDFAAAATRQVPVVFLSSIATVDGWDAPSAVPEGPVADLRVPAMGYGRSKAVSSLLLDLARERSGIPTASIRIGQIAGPRGGRGMWNRQEFLPTMIASSLYLGVMPESLVRGNIVDWMPVEDVASTILEMAGATQQQQRLPVDRISGYLHCVNPRKTSWDALAPAIADFYGGRIKKLVSFEEWVDTLAASAASTSDLNRNPSVKLLDSYRNMMLADRAGRAAVELAVERSASSSATLRDLGPVTPELMIHWCRQWGF